MTLSSQLDANYVAVKSLDFDQAGESKTPLQVDSSFSKVTVSVSGSDAKLSATYPNSTVVPSEDFSSDNIKIKTFDANEMLYSILASAASAYSIRVGGTSGLNFKFGFSVRAPTFQADTQLLPIDEHRNILSIFVSDTSLVKKLTKAMLIPAVDDFTPYEIQLEQSSGGFYSSKSFDVPTNMFKIKIYGEDSKGNVINRLISTGIESCKSESCDTLPAEPPAEAPADTMPDWLKEVLLKFG